MKLLFCLGLVACSSAEQKSASVDGAELYKTFCSSCHGLEGKPDATMIARLGVRDLTSAELRARITPALVEQQVRKGSQNKLMPAFEGAFSDEQIRAIARFVSDPKFLR